MSAQENAYKKAGVDINRMSAALQRAGRQVRSTRTASVLGDVGSFGGLFKAPGREAVLVTSIDGVGTKLSVAKRAKRHDTIGQDLVNHCVNDILVQGAEPLFFVDYLGTSRLDAALFEKVISGLTKACKQNGCALIGGETAEMPGLYPKGEYDLVGSIVGAVKRRDLITGASIRAGDVLVGLHSSGLHTNGYSLARRIIFEQARHGIHTRFPGTSRSVAQVLLAIHRSYLKPVRQLMRTVRIRGMAHITGGGLVDNIPRILPDGVGATIDCSAWKRSALFNYLQEKGGVRADEMYRVFNMGIGFVVMVRKRDAEKAITTLKKAGERPRVIGEIVKGNGGVTLDHI